MAFQLNWRAAGECPVRVWAGFLDSVSCPARTNGPHGGCACGDADGIVLATLTMLSCPCQAVATHNTVLQTDSPRAPVEIADPDGRVRTAVRLRFSHNIAGFELHNGVNNDKKGGGCEWPRPGPAFEPSRVSRRRCVCCGMGIGWGVPPMRSANAVGVPARRPVLPRTHVCLTLPLVVSRPLAPLCLTHMCAGRALPSVVSLAPPSTVSPPRAIADTNMLTDLPPDVYNNITEFDYNYYQHLGAGSAWKASGADGHPIPKVVRSAQLGDRYGLNLSEWQQQSSLDAHSGDGQQEYSNTKPKGGNVLDSAGFATRTDGPHEGVRTRGDANESDPAATLKHVEGLFLGLVPGVTVPDKDLWLDPRTWSDPAFMAHFTPDPAWSRCAGADTPGAVDCAGNRLGVMAPFEEFKENGGLGWAGPPIIRERYPLPSVAATAGEV